MMTASRISAGTTPVPMSVIMTTMNPAISEPICGIRSKKPTVSARPTGNGASTICPLTPTTGPAITGPVPVLPGVGSMIVPPARRRPSRSAASTSRIATRSLIEPPGLNDSSLATICGRTPAAIRLRRTSGVSPTVSRIESLMSACAPVADVLMGWESRRAPVLGPDRVKRQRPRLWHAEKMSPLAWWQDLELDLRQLEPRAGQHDLWAGSIVECGPPTPRADAQLGDDRLSAEHERHG